MKRLLIIVFIFLTSYDKVVSQTYSIIHIEGEAYYYTTKVEKKTYSKLVFGPLHNFESIVLKPKAVVKIKRNDNYVSVLNQEGTFNLAHLDFKEVSDNSVFGKFCKYFESFFTNHSSTESKNNYKNNIYAISRGLASPPSLDFPLYGSLPIDAGSLPFIWTHACDTCEYIFTVNDLDTREIIYTEMTNQKKIEIESPQKYLKPNHKYYWSVKIAGMDLEYENIEFSTVGNGSYQSKLSDINVEIDQSSIPLKGVSKTIYIISEFDETNFINFALLYSFQAIKASPNDTTLADLIDRYWYDRLMEK